MTSPHTTPANHEVRPSDPELGTPAVVNPHPESRLAQLAAEHDAAKKAAADTKARLEEITDAIKAELTRAAPGEPEVLLTSPYLSKPLQLQAETRRRLDTKGMKAEDPATYWRWVKPSTSWYLRAVG